MDDIDVYFATFAKSMASTVVAAFHVPLEQPWTATL